jgi:predicted nucleic acid-binding protein
VNTLRFLDTNVLLYSISGVPQEVAKRRKAVALLERDDCALSVQVLQEFYVQATRASRTDRVSHDIAVGLIETWMRFPIQETTLKLLANAFQIKASHQLSYWDSAIVAAAAALGCREIYSEDMGHARKIEGMTIVNPFRLRR